MPKKLPKYQSNEQKYIYLNNYKDYLSTFDLGASAYLITTGFELTSLDKTNPRKVQFIFRREAGIEKVIDDYWANRLKVPARAFFDNVKMLKNRIFSE